METRESTTLQVEIAAEDFSAEELDAITRQLLFELREMNVESAELVRGEPAPTGAKSADPVTMGTITLAVLPVVLPKVVEFIQTWAMRGNSRTVKFKGKIGKDEIEFEGPPEELKKLLDTLQRKKRT